MRTRSGRFRRRARPGGLVGACWTDELRKAEARLQEILRNHFDLADATSSELFIRDVSASVMDFLLHKQAALRTAIAVQDSINRRLGREAPQRAIKAADIDVYNLLQADDSDRMPNLVEELERLFGIAIELDAGSLAITQRDGAACA